MRGKWVLISVAAVLAGVGGAYFAQHWKGRAGAAVHKGAAALIQNGSEITISGKLRPQHVTTVAAETEGDLDAFVADVGQDVFVGQVLARIGASGLENQREAAQSTVTYAEGQVARAESNLASAQMESSRADADQQRARLAIEKIRANYELEQKRNQAGAISKNRWEKAQKEYQDAQKDLEIMSKAARLSAEGVQTALNALSTAQKNLADRNADLTAAQENMASAEVRSPVDGVIVARNGEQGKPAGADLFLIATDLFSLEVPLEPRPEILKRLHVGQQALVLIPDLQSSGLPGQVKEIKGTEVVVEFTCALPAVRPGMTADVRLKLD